MMSLACILRGWRRLCAGVLLAVPLPAMAAVDYPARPISIVVTFPPGGGTDLLARKLAAGLQQTLGQPVVVENRPGASGNIGAQWVAQAPADGYTLLMVNSSFAINPWVYTKLAFAPERDFSAVINLALTPTVLVTAAGSPLASLQEVIASREQPLPYASCGNGTPQHLAAEMLRSATGAVLQHVPYRGCGPALIDVLSGQVPLGLMTVSSAAPFIHSGQLRALALTSAQRSPLLPQVATVAEQGVADYQLEQWHGLLAPAGTPQAVLEKLNAVLAAWIRAPALQQELLQLGFSPVASTPEQFQALIAADMQRFDVLVARIGLQID